eukprot:scaffold27_cov125-Isochrysis_galbana.AAC.4
MHLRSPSQPLVRLRRYAYEHLHLLATRGCGLRTAAGAGAGAAPPCCPPAALSLMASVGCSCSPIATTISSFGDVA